MNKNLKETIILIGGSGRLGSKLISQLGKKYNYLIIDKVQNKNNFKNIFFNKIDFENDDLDFSNLKLKIKKISAIINLVRPSKQKKKSFDSSASQLIQNLYFLIEKILKLNKFNKINFLNISSTNVKMISQQNFEYHFFKLGTELMTNYFSVKYIKKNMYFNNLRVGLIKTKNLPKIFKKKKNNFLMSNNKIADYLKISKTIEKIFLKNDILNGVTIDLDSSISKIDQIYFSNLIEK